MSVKVMSLVWDHFPRGGSEKLTMLAMADWCNDSGESLHPSISAIAKKICCTEKQARRVVHGLIDDGYLVVIGNHNGGDPGQSRCYRIVLDKLTPPVDVTPPTQGRGKSEKKTNPEKSGATPPMDVTPPVDVTPPMDGSLTTKILNTTQHAHEPDAETMAKASRRGKICRVLLDAGFAATPGDGAITDWVNDGISDDDIQEAIARARLRKPTDRLVPAYLTKILGDIGLEHAKRQTAKTPATSHSTPGLSLTSTRGNSHDRRSQREENLMRGVEAAIAYYGYGNADGNLIHPDGDELRPQVDDLVSVGSFVPYGRG